MMPPSDWPGNNQWAHFLGQWMKWRAQPPVGTATPVRWLSKQCFLRVSVVVTAAGFLTWVSAVASLSDGLLSVIQINTFFPQEVLGLVSGFFWTLIVSKLWHNFFIHNLHYSLAWRNHCFTRLFPKHPCTEGDSVLLLPATLITLARGTHSSNSEHFLGSLLFMMHCYFKNAGMVPAWR